MSTLYQACALTRSELDARSGDLLLQFGVDGCGHCQRAEPAITAALETFPSIDHLRIEDGAGRPLGRSLGVRLWPTLVLLRDGQELDRLVRPTQAAQVIALLRPLGAAPTRPNG